MRDLLTTQMVRRVSLAPAPTPILTLTLPTLHSSASPHPDPSPFTVALALTLTLILALAPVLALPLALTPRATPDQVRRVNKLHETAHRKIFRKHAKADVSKETMELQELT